MPDVPTALPSRQMLVWEVFLAFFMLGLTSFGGPIAHIGYFRDELVLRRRWLSDAHFADLVALCQFLPGPASSQLGFALGILRSGSLWGGLAAWTAFTVPSAAVLILFGLGLAHGDGLEGPLHGLKLVAVAVVAQAVWGMARTLAPDRVRAGIALAAATSALLLAGAFGQSVAILAGVVAGLAFCRGETALPSSGLPIPISARRSCSALALWAALLIGLPLIAALTHCHAAEFISAFYQAGALVFGGGHVVLPLLQTAVVAPGWVSPADFLAGYGLAQAVPGPLFTFAAYLGAVAGPSPTGIVGAAIALVAIFLPGLLLVYGTLPFWNRLRSQPQLQAALRGANAAVVGILGAALYTPVWTSAVLTPLDFLMALAGFLALTVWRLPPWIVVAGLAAGSWVLA
ncbi:MAG: chromate transporter [Rhizobiales bacterium 32-66-8]|nr:MAG: chromate transporter [Rhizobiales bacterium 32-66-8]